MATARAKSDAGPPTPDKQADNRRPGRNGLPPPVEHRWKPGQSGNSKGRPKARTLTERLRDLLDKGEINGQPIKDGKQVADLLVEAILKAAIQGKPPVIKEVWDRLEGKVPDRMELGGPDGGPIPVALTELTRDELDSLRAIAGRLAEGDSEGGPDRD